MLTLSKFLRIVSRNFYELVFYEFGSSPECRGPGRHRFGIGTIMIVSASYRSVVSVTIQSHSFRYRTNVRKMVIGMVKSLNSLKIHGLTLISFSSKEVSRVLVNWAYCFEFAGFLPVFNVKQETPCCSGRGVFALDCVVH